MLCGIRETETSPWWVGIIRRLDAEEADRLQAQLRALERQWTRILDAFQAELLDKAELARRKERLDQEQLHHEAVEGAEALHRPDLLDPFGDGHEEGVGDADDLIRELADLKGDVSLGVIRDKNAITLKASLQ